MRWGCGDYDRKSAQIFIYQCNGQELTIRCIYIQIITTTRPMKGRGGEEIINEIIATKKKLETGSTELENYLQYLDQLVFKRNGFAFCGPSKATATPEFARAISTFNDNEKAEFYLTCLRIVQDLARRREPSLLEPVEQQRFEVLSRDDRKSKDWRLTFIIINFSKMTMFYGFTGEIIQLKHYLIRASKCKDHRAFVLESSYRNILPLTLRITQTNQLLYEQLFVKVKRLIQKGQKQKVQMMMALGKQSRDDPKKKPLQKRESISVQIANNSAKKSLRSLLNQGSLSIDFTMEEYNRITNSLINESMLQNLNDYKEYEKVKEGVYLNLTKSKVKKQYLFDQRDVTVDWLADQLFNFDNFKLWKASLFMISLLADIHNEKTMIFHEINMYKDSNECDYVYLRHQFNRDGYIFFIDKSIQTLQYGSHETSNRRGKIEYCIWRIGKHPKGGIQVLIEAQVSHIPCLDIHEAISEQIGEVQNILLCRNSKIKNNRKSQRTTVSKPIQQSMSFMKNSLSVISSYAQGIKQFEQFTSYQGVSPEHSKSKINEDEYFSITSEAERNFNNNNVVWEIQSTSETNDYYRYQIDPALNKKKKYREFVSDVFFDRNECFINEKGDLVFTNEEKIKAQSSVLKNVLKRMSSNLFSGKSVLNISLPIGIFGKDTNLQRISRGMAYAPHFLQNMQKASAIQRMKAAICFSVGNILLYIEMTKPFNPILGETYQGFIDGCPIYGEQISHHPPISSIFMVGRGYFVHANLEAKVQFGMNSACGINQGDYIIAFHDKDPSKNIIKFTGPPGELSGVIYGERKLNLVKKTRFLDVANMIYCEISWGKGKSKNNIQRFNDFMEGRIVRLKKYQENLTKIKQADIDEVLGHITGRWTEQIYFNDEIIFDVNKLKPYTVEDEVVPLKSDSCYRQDLIAFAENRISEAQTAKEELEQIQRRDRKLRKEYAS